MAFLRPFSLLLVAFGLALVLAHTAAPQSEDDRPRVLAVEFDNDVNPVTADYLIGEIDRANEENYDAVVLLVDTPGGLDTAMRDIIKAELASEVPVILYVSPPGSRAASAGVFLGDGRRRRRDGAGDEHRLVDADLLVGRATSPTDLRRKVDQRRGRLHPRAGREPRPKRRLGRGRGAQGRRTSARPRRSSWASSTTSRPTCRRS